MRRNEQVVLAVLALVGVAVGFWFLVLGPKRHEASTLSDQAARLRGSLSDAQQQVAAGERARSSFGADYRRLVVLGKAVPGDDEQASLLVELRKLAYRSGVQFQSINLAEASGASTPPPPTSTDSSSSSGSSTSGDTSSSSGSSSSSDASSTSSTTSSTTSVPATEAAASTLPIGASIGPAGLPVMAYQLSFSGRFFGIADFMRRLDGLVHAHGDVIDVHGRLLTVNGFTLEPAENPKSLANPVLTANLDVTTYLTPADQGLTAGATASGPSTSGPTLASSSTTTTSTTTGTGTAP